MVTADAQDIVCPACAGAGDSLIIPHGAISYERRVESDTHFLSTYRSVFELIGEIPKSREVYNIRNAVDVFKQFSKHFGEDTQQRGEHNEPMKVFLRFIYFT